MKLFGLEKTDKGYQFYFLGIKLYEAEQQIKEDKTSFTAINYRKKKLSPSFINKIHNKLLLFAAKKTIFSLGQHYEGMPTKERYFICFDFLKNPKTEAIDAYTFFQHLQSKGIPSKYVLLRENPLYKKLEEDNNLKDILPVDNELQLLTDYPDIVAQSRFVLNSFGFSTSKIFKLLPFCKYIFIEHGVSLLKTWVTNHYKEEHFDGKLIPTVLTKNYFDSIHCGVPTCTKYHCGFPRWDKLSPLQKKEKRKIFIFFTFRDSFRDDTRYIDEYINRIQSFVKKLNTITRDKNIQLYLSLHHYIFHICPNLEESIKGVNLVPTNNVSTMVREADMCITDFSSIGFDFLYRNVPVIYYCFDTDVKYSNKNDRIEQLANSIDSHLYNCCRDEKSTIEKIQHYIHRDFELEPEFIDKNDSIFWERGSNCERLLNLLLETE